MLPDITPLRVKILNRDWRFEEYLENSDIPGRNHIVRDLEPIYDHEGDSGMRLYVLEDTLVHPFVPTRIPHGIAVQPLPGYNTRITSRSSTYPKKNLLVITGTVDQPYTGELSSMVMYVPQPRRVIVKTFSARGESPEETLAFSPEPLLLKKGDRVSQLVLETVARASVQRVDDLVNTSRGSSGWGSTGR